MARLLGLIPDYELKLLSEGYDFVVGIDEVGRGCWAGPMVLGVFFYKTGTETLDGVNDSKIVTRKSRENLFDKLIPDTEIIEVDDRKIDEIGIGKATTEAIMNLVSNYAQEKYFFLVDGNLKFPGFKNVQSVIDGDAKIYCIAAASIVAKVHRDNFMKEISTRFPGYGFEKHVGYGTKQHIDALRKLGVSSIHRKSYRPIREFLQN